MAEPFQFDLVAPEKLLMSEPVEQVVVPGGDGYFTVLKGHSPLMSTIRPGVVDIIKVGGGAPVRIFVRGGFAEVGPKGLTILAEQAIAFEDLSTAKLAAEIRMAEEDVADAATDSVKSAAQLKLAQLQELQRALAS